jgi:hypothetical protein
MAVVLQGFADPFKISEDRIEIGGVVSGGTVPRAVRTCSVWGHQSLRSGAPF